MVNKTLKSKKVTAADIWDQPNMSVISDAKHPAPEFPIHVFNERWQECIKRSAEVKGSSLDFAAAAIILAIASTLGSSRRISAWDGYNQPAILWGVLIGLPSTNKSPAIENVTEPLMRLEELISINHEDEMKAWKVEKEKAEIYNAEWQRKFKKAIKNGETSPLKPKEAYVPPKPIKPRTVIIDVTIEAAVVILSGNPRGLLLIRDELSGVMKNMNRYNGSDQEFYLSAYDGGAYSVDRVKNEETVNVTSLSISMLGGIQPDKLDEVLKVMPDDGFIARFLMFYPEHKVRDKPKVKPDDEFIYKSLDRLRSLPMETDDEGKVKSKIIPLSTKACDKFSVWKLEGNKRELDTSGILTSFVGKTPGIVLRLALVLKYMDWVVSDSKSEPEEIRVDYINRAITLVEKYFIPMARRTLSDTGMPQEEKDAKSVARWIMKEKPSIINLSHFTRMSGSPIRDRSRARAAFDYLVESNWLQFIGGRDAAPKAGGKQRLDYSVNPLLFK